MRISNDKLLFYCFFFFYCSIVHSLSIRNYKLESQVGSTIILPPCLSTSSSSMNNDTTTILFKSDSGELLIMNGKLVSQNPRFLLKNDYSSELIIKSVHPLDHGLYECRTDQNINAIIHLNIVHRSTIHLTVPENSNLTLQCMDKGMWIIEESHRGGPIRTQYTTDLILNNIQRNDQRFRTIICSNFNGQEKREYVIDVTYKPTVKLMLSTRRRLICLICAHPLPHRIQWWWNTRKERDDHIHQTNINQSCIAQQITLVLPEQRSGNDYSSEQMITCEAENPYGTDRDSLFFKAASNIIDQKSTMEKFVGISTNSMIKFGSTEMNRLTSGISRTSVTSYFLIFPFFFLSFR